MKKYIKFLKEQNLRSICFSKGPLAKWKPKKQHHNTLKIFSFIAFYGIVLYHQKQNQGECNEAQRQDIMVNGSCPKKFIPSPE